MEQRSVTLTTFVIERSYPKSPEHVFAAFADHKKKRRWFAEGEGFELEKFEMDFRAGGKEISRFRTSGDAPFKNAVFTNDTTYQVIVPSSRVVLAYTMSVGDKCISASLATFEFAKTAKGTDLLFTEQAAY